MVFIVDDEIDVASTLADLLKEGLSLNSKLFQSLDECMKELESSEQPQLIISDVMMPTGSGLRLISLIEKKHLNIPVIFISGHADKIAQEDIILLRKPVQKEQLFEAVRSILPDR